MSIDDVAHCLYKGIPQYQRFLDAEERQRITMANAYCLVNDDKCPYSKIYKGQYLCNYSRRDKDEKKG